MKKELDLEPALTEIKLRLKEHIGSFGNAHLPATKDMNGFMTSQMVVEHQNLLNRTDKLFYLRDGLQNANGTDILALPVGYYSGSNFTNYPFYNPTDINKDHSYISVIPSSQQNRRLFIVTNASSNSVYIKSVNDDWDVQKPWGQFEQKVLLWKGSSKLADPVELADNVKNGNTENYNKIRVYGMTDSGNVAISEGSSKGFNINATNQDNNVDAFGPAFYECFISFPTANSAQVVRSTSTALYPKSTTDPTAVFNNRSNESGINIREIWGIR